MISFVKHDWLAQDMRKVCSNPLNLKWSRLEGEMKQISLLQRERVMLFEPVPIFGQQRHQLFRQLAFFLVTFLSPVELLTVLCSIVSASRIVNVI